jgi:hypothetical protein
MQSGESRPGFYTGDYKRSLVGGLYTQASPINVPEGYSPAMENVFLNDRYNLQTRYGMQALIESEFNVQGLYCFQTKFGVTLLVAKTGKSLKVYRITENEDKDTSASLFTNLLNVWSDEAASSFADFTPLNTDSRLRLIITTGTNTPVQLRFTERQVIVDDGNTTVISIADASEFVGATASNIKVFDDGVELTYTTDYIVNGGNQIVFTVPREGVFDIIHVGWQWFTEAIVTYGFNLSRTEPRFNTDVSDLSIPTPPEMLIGIEPVPGARNRLPIRLYKNGLRTGLQTYALNPDVETDYAYTGGSYRTSTNRQNMMPGITHVTFGDVNSTSTDISELSFIKAINIEPFNSGLTVSANGLRVFVDDVFANFATSNQNADFGRFWHGSSVNEWVNDSRASTNTEAINYVHFDATDSVGLRAADVVRVIRSAEPTAGAPRFIGTAINTGDTSLPYERVDRGNWWPAYGFAEHCEYAKGSFPRYCETHENRLVFAGFPLRPNLLVMSAVLDTTVRGDFYSDFQIREQEGLDTNSVVLDINTTSTSGITGLVSSAGVLFVFTSEETFIVSGGENGITPISKRVSKIAGVGAVNSNCFVEINDSVLFLARSGVYRLSQDFEQAGGWRVRKVTQPINDRQRSKANLESAWLTMLPNDDTLYLSYTDPTINAKVLAVWRQDAQFWTRFVDTFGVWNATLGAFADLNRNYLLMGMDAGRLVSYPYRLPIDQHTQDYIVPLVQPVTPQAVNNLGFRALPDVGIDDIASAGVTNFFKTRDDRVFVGDTGGPAAALYPKAIGDEIVVGYTAAGVLVSVDHDPLDGSFTLGDATETGYVYKCFVTTPTLFATSNNNSSFINSYKTVHFATFVFHTNGEYPNFKVNVKRVDTDPTQITEYVTYPEYDNSSATQFDKALHDAATELVRPMLKLVAHTGGIETPFHQFIVFSDSINSWELISYQAEVSQSSVRMR